MKNKLIYTTIKEYLNENMINSFNDLKEWSYKYVKTNAEGFNSSEDAIEYLDWFLGIVDTLPSKLKLYRILQVDNKSDINKKTLGVHFTDNKDNFTDGFLQSLGFSRGDIQDKNFFIVTILIDKEQIDFKNTITTRLSFPYEDEYTLKDNANYEITNIEKFKKENY